MATLSLKLKQRIVNFLLSLPNIDNSDAQRAFVYSAGVDSALREQISFDRPPSMFIPLLVETLSKYGTLNDGRNALEAVLETAKNYIGYDKKVYCDSLIQELRSVRSPTDGERHLEEFRAIPNPFIYGNPIRPEEAEVFVGRLDIVERINKLVTTEPKPTLFLYGRRRSGKTSTLLNLHRFLGKQVICVFFDMQDVRFSESSEAFCFNVSDFIVQQIPKLSTLWRQQDFTRNPFSTFAKFLDAVEAFAIEHKVVILLTFDEYERLDTKHTDILNTLRTMIQHRRKIIIL